MGIRKENTEVSQGYDWIFLEIFGYIMSVMDEPFLFMGLKGISGLLVMSKSQLLMAHLEI